MSNFRVSVHLLQHEWLRPWVVQKSKKISLVCRAITIKLDVIYSVTSEVETGDQLPNIF